MEAVSNLTALSYRRCPIVLHGNPFEGFELIGPFKTGAEAYDWASKCCHLEWWVMDAHDPYEYT